MQRVQSRRQLTPAAADPAITVAGGAGWGWPGGGERRVAGLGRRAAELGR
jgi:hypothetical protein